MSTLVVEELEDNVYVYIVCPRFPSSLNSLFVLRIRKLRGGVLLRLEDLHCRTGKLHWECKNFHEENENRFRSIVLRGGERDSEW